MYVKILHDVIKPIEVHIFESGPTLNLKVKI